MLLSIENLTEFTKITFKAKNTFIGVQDTRSTFKIIVGCNTLVYETMLAISLYSYP
jgi:hypothetical protein